MIHTLKFKIVIFFTLICWLNFSGCSGDKSMPVSSTPTFSESPAQTMTPIPSSIPTITSTPTFNSRTFIITPDALFSIPEREIFNTPDSTDFCENIPPAEVVENMNKLSLLAGRFSLCVSRNWRSVMDLDNGTLVALDDINGDIAMNFSHTGLDRKISYYVKGLNNAHIDEIDTNVLNYEYCENLVLGLNRPGVLHVREGAVACVLTTEARIALIRVEHIYPFNTQAVEFSFAVLRK